MILWIAYILTGACASFLAGLLGIGGGLIIIPALMFVFSYFHVVDSYNLMHLTIGTSLATSIVNLISSVIAHQKKQNIRWPLFKIMTPGILLGSLLIGPVVMVILSGSILKIIFGIACFVFGTEMLISQKNAEGTEKLPGPWLLSLIGLIIGTLSTLLGLAGGMMVGTTLNYYRMDMRKVVGTTASIALILAASGSIGLMIVSYNEPNLPPGSTGYIYWPAFLGIAILSPFFAPLGAKIAQKLPVTLLKRLFGALIFAIGIQMLI